MCDFQIGVGEGGGGSLRPESHKKMTMTMLVTIFQCNYELANQMRSTYQTSYVELAREPTPSIVMEKIHFSFLGFAAENSNTKRKRVNVN